jgi:acyl carrier protein
MSAETVESRVETIMRRHARRDLRDIAISSDTRLLDDLQINSASIIDIALALEDEFGFTLSDEEIDGLRTFGESVALISRKLDPAP